MKNILLFSLIFTSSILWGNPVQIVVSTDVVDQTDFTHWVDLSLTDIPHQIERVYSFPKAPVMLWVYRVDSAQLSTSLSLFSKIPHVRTVEIEGTVTTCETERRMPNDSHFQGQWHLDNDGEETRLEDADIDAPEGWVFETGSTDITLAILDTGVEMNHPEFANRAKLNSIEIINGIDDDNNGFVDDVLGWDYISDDNDPSDENGHGTAVAGLAAANGDNSLGLAGIDWKCKILPLRVLNENGSGSHTGVAAAIYYATDMGANVINLSLGSKGASEAIHDAVIYATDNNVVVVAASGNADDPALLFPAGFDEVIGVGATNFQDERCSPFGSSNSGGSNYGSNLDVVAPGDLLPILRYQDFTSFSTIGSGTSFASPIVSGIACLLLAQTPTLSSIEVREIIRSTAEDMVGNDEDSPGFDNYYGYGRVNLYNALTRTYPFKAEETMTVFPNPFQSSGSFFLVYDSFHCTISNIQGQVVYYESTLGRGKHTISNLPAGHYVLTVFTAVKGFESVPFIVL